MIQLELCRIENKGNSGRILFVGNDLSYLIEYGKDVLRFEAGRLSKAFECTDLTLRDGLSINPVSGSGRFTWKEPSTDRLFELTFDKSIITIKVYDSRTGQTLYLREFHSELEGVESGI